MSISKASINYTEEENEEDRIQDCIYATCEVSGDAVGPVWGHSEASVKRALATLTEECSCGAGFHHSAEEA